MKIVSLDLGPIESATDLHTLMARTFHFPAHYGGNWDAWVDSMTDSMEERASPVTLKLRSWETWATKNTSESSVFLLSVADLNLRLETKRLYLALVFC